MTQRKFSPSIKKRRIDADFKSVKKIAKRSYIKRLNTVQEFFIQYCVQNIFKVTYLEHLRNIEAQRA
jgi:hypothetical protein